MSVIIDPFKKQEPDHTYTSAKESKPLTKEDIENILKKISTPQAIVLMPNGNCLDVYKCDAKILKAAIALILKNEVVNMARV